MHLEKFSLNFSSSLFASLGEHPVFSALVCTGCKLEAKKPDALAGYLFAIRVNLLHP